MTVRRPDARASVLLTACLLTLAAGCTGTDPRTAPSTSPAMSSTTMTPPPSSTPPPAASSTTDPESRAVIAAYDGMWADMVAAARTADYRSPLLAAHTVDPATGQLRRTLLTFQQLGWVAKGSVTTHPTVIPMDSSEAPMQAEIVDCLDETHWLTYSAATDQLTDDKPGQRHQVTALMRRTADGWKVESFTIAAGGSC